MFSRQSSPFALSELSSVEPLINRDLFNYCFVLCALLGARNVMLTVFLKAQETVLKIDLAVITMIFNL